MEIDGTFNSICTPTGYPHILDYYCECIEMVNTNTIYLRGCGSLSGVG
jgi:hypothetical protein